MLLQEHWTLVINVVPSIDGVTIYFLLCKMVCQVYRQRPVGLLGLAAFGNDLPPDFPPETEVVSDLYISPVFFCVYESSFPPSVISNIFF